MLYDDWLFPGVTEGRIPKSCSRNPGTPELLESCIPEIWHYRNPGLLESGTFVVRHPLGTGTPEIRNSGAWRLSAMSRQSIDCKILPCSRGPFERGWSMVIFCIYLWVNVLQKYGMLQGTKVILSIPLLGLNGRRRYLQTDQGNLRECWRTFNTINQKIFEMYCNFKKPLYLCSPKNKKP